MLQNYKITGLFYTKKGFHFREYLNIRRKSSNQSKPDLMIIMMNPGSSKPLVDNFYNKEVLTKPDNTQYQIIKLMEQFDYNYARILNLSDYREPKSKVFYKKISELEKNGISHSIFSTERKKDFKKLFVNTVPVIFAWGVNYKLRFLAKNAIEKIGKKNPIGIKKEKKDYAYYHPLPRSHQKQKDWIKNINEIIKAHNNLYS